MERTVKLPYCTRYLSGTELGLGWLKAITLNDRHSAKRLDWHAHDEMEMIFPLRGRYNYEFKDRCSIVGDNNGFFVVPGGALHRLGEAIDPPGGRIHLYLKAPGAESVSEGGMTADEYDSLYRKLAGRGFEFLTISSQVKTEVSDIGRLLAKDDLASVAVRQQLRFLCSLALCRCVHCRPEIADVSQDQIIKESVSWLEDRICEDVDFDQLVSYIGFSRARFFAVFKQRTGRSPGVYLRNLRIEKAKELLARTRFSAMKIGRDCGLGDPTHFSRIFRQMTGCTPLEYRRKTLSAEEHAVSEGS